MQAWADKNRVGKVTYAAFSAMTRGLLSPSRISNYANGIRMPGPKEANIMANALACDAAWLMCLQLEMNKEELDLLRNFRALPEKDRKSYYRRIEVLSMAYREPTPDETAPAPDVPPTPGVRRKTSSNKS